MQLLEHLYSGNFDPAMPIPKNPEYKKAMQRVTKSEDALMDTLTEEEKELLKQYISAQMDANCMVTVDKFILGFSLGAMLLTEASQAINGLLQSE